MTRSDGMDAEDAGTGARAHLEQVARVADVLRQREEYVARGLAWLGGSGLLDEPAQRRLWQAYQEGDEATRRFLGEQIQRVLGSMADPKPGRGDADAVDAVELEVLERLSSPEVDVQEVAEEVRRFDPFRFLGEGKDAGPVMRFLSEVPLVVHRFQRRLMWTGGFLLGFVVALLGAAVVFPVIVPWVGLAGVVLLALVLGVLLVRTGGWIGRSAKEQGIDLGVYARLPDDERRLLLVRRIGLRVLDPERLAGWMERGKAEPEGPPQSSGRERERRTASAQRRRVPPEDGEKTRAAAADLGTVETTAGSQETQEGSQDPSRLAQWLTAGVQALQRAARSQRTQQVRKEVAGRARSAGRSARQGFEGMRERGQEELKRRREAAAAQKSPVGSSAKRGNRVGPQGNEAAKKRSGGKTRSQAVKHASKKQGARTGAASKGARKQGGKKQVRKTGKRAGGAAARKRGAGSSRRSPAKRGGSS